MPLRRVFLGDWGKWLRDPLDLLRLVFVAAAVLLWLAGRSTAISMTVAAVVVVVIRFIDLPRPYDLAAIVAAALISWGTALDLYGRVDDYDKFVHFLAPLCYAPVLYIFGIRLSMLPDLRDAREHHLRIGILLVTLAVGMAVSAGYEICEWSIDKLLNAHLVKGETDTAEDLLAGTIGSAIGALLLVVWSVFGWATVRRLPPQRVR